MYKRYLMLRTSLFLMVTVKTLRPQATAFLVDVYV